MADCLTTLRQWTMEAKKPQEMIDPNNEELLVFGDFAWPKNTKTNYVMYTHSESTDGKQYYTLESVWFLLQHIKLPHSKYVREANNNTILAVRRPDRNQLLEFLKGGYEIPKSLDRRVDLAPPIYIKGGDDSEEETEAPTDVGMSEIESDDDQVTPQSQSRGETPRYEVPRPVHAMTPHGVTPALITPGHGITPVGATPYEATPRVPDMSRTIPRGGLTPMGDDAPAPPRQPTPRDTAESPDAMDNGSIGGSPFSEDDYGPAEPGNYMDDDDISTSYVPSEFTAGPISEVTSTMAPSSKKFKAADGSAKIKPSMNSAYQPAIPKPIPPTRPSAKSGPKNIDKLRDKILRKKPRDAMPPPRDVKPFDAYNTPDMDATPHDNFFEPDMGGHLDHPSEVQKIIEERERTWQTRHTVLQIPSKSFKDILRILDDTHKEKRTKEVEKVDRRDPQNKQMPRYSRYDQERYNTARGDMRGFKIDTRKVFGELHKRPSASPAPVPMKRPTHDRSSIPSYTPDSSKPNSKKKQSRTPIIIIPAANTSLITAFNARPFLEDYTYTDSNARRKQADPNERAGDFLIQRKKQLPNGEQIAIPYRIINNANKLEPRDWERVVGVFVQGPKWQFKGWPWLGANDAAEDIFLRTCAFHLRFANLPMDKNVGKWQVEILEMPANNRHQDAATIRKMWAHLENWMMKHKPHLRF